MRKRKLLFLIMAMAMVLSLLPMTVWAVNEDTWEDAVTAAPAGYVINTENKTVDISSAEGLAWFAKEINSWESKAEGEKMSFAEYTINITKDIDLSGKLWIPIDASTVKLTGVTEQQKIDRDQSYNNTLLKDATINGNNHTISNMVVKTTVRGPRYESVPGDGQNSYYYAGFIGRTSGNLTINDLTFTTASVDASLEQFVTEHGGSSLAVVSGYYGGGTLTLNNVTISDCFVDGMQKVGGYVGQCNGSVTINKCAVVNSTFRSLYQCAPVIAYAMNNQYNNDDGSDASKRANTLAINGVKLENNSVVMVKDAETTYKTFGDNVDTCYYTTNDGYNFWCGNQADTILIAQDRFSPVSGTSDVVADTPLKMAAEVGGYQYDTLAAAIAAVPNGVETTVKLAADCQLDATVTIPLEKIVVLDLNGKTVTESGVETRKLCNYGQLTILSSVAGGTIKNKDEGSYGLIDNYGTLKIQSGNFENYGRASGAAIKNREGATLLEISGGVFAGLVEDLNGDQNGYATAANVLVASDAPLVVTGGTFSNRAHYSAVFKIFQDDARISNVTVSTYMAGGIEVAGGNAMLTDCEFHVAAENSYYANAVAVSNGGTVSIDGGKYTGYKYTAYVYNSGGTINICNGNFEAQTTLKADKSIYGSQPSKINVTGGAFTGDFGIADGATLSISGGYFTRDPSQYVVEGQNLAAILGEYVINGQTYNYQVTTALPTDVEVVAGSPEVNNPNNVADEVVEGIKNTQVSGISQLANEEAQDIPDENKADESKFNAAAGSLDEAIPEANGKVTTVVAPRLDITVKGYDSTAGNQKLTLEIKAVYDIKATTATDSANMEEYDGSNASDVNTVTLKQNAGTLDTTGTEVRISVPLPSGFVNNISDNVFVIHTKDDGTKYIYKATVTSDEQSTPTYTAAFINPHGFSSFVLTTETAASITDNGTTVYYDTLQEAVDAVKNNQTIKLEKDVTDSAVVGRTVSFTLDLNSKSFTGSITAGANTTAAAGNPGAGVGGTYSFTYTTPSSGGGSVTTYAITVDKGTHGTVTASTARASRGTTVTITVKPDQGYELDSLSITASNGSKVTLTDKGDGKYTFTMPAASVTVTASFRAVEQANPADAFTDVSSSAWYFSAVSYVAEHGLMSGTSETTFGPGVTLSRSMIAQMLYALEGKPAVSVSAGFSDVPNGLWFSDAINWAQSQGVISGYDGGLFGPNDPLTREQLTLILFNYADLKGYDITGRADLSSFSDGSSTALWAQQSMAWAVDAGLLSGRGSNRLEPAGTATRAEVAQIMMNFCENVAK